MPDVKRLNWPLWILAMCLFWVLSLYANGDADREFLKNSRAELNRLDEISQQKNNIGNPTATLNSGLDLSYVPPSRGGHSVSAIPQKTEEEERAEEEDLQVSDGHDETWYNDCGDQIWLRLGDGFRDQDAGSYQRAKK